MGDDLNALSRLQLESARTSLLGEVLGLMAQYRPEVLYRYRDEFKDYDRSARALLEAIEETLAEEMADEARWKAFVAEHPELVGGR